MVTVGLPVYNNENDLVDTLRSIFAQTYEDWEIIAIDDGSQDKSLDILMSINDPRVKVFHDGRNRKLAYRLNEINERAKSDFILRMDSGDMCSPRRIERQLNFIRSYGLDIVSTQIAVVDTNNNVLNLRKSLDHSITLKNYLKFGSSIGHPTILTKSSWSKNNKYSTLNKRTEDYELWIRSISNGSLNDSIHARIDEPLYFYRDDANVSVSQIETSFNERNEIIRNYGKGMLSNSEIRKLIYKNNVKKLALKALSKVNVYGKVKTSFLRSNEHSSNDVNNVKNEIDTILKTKIPGID
ncbi:glycosyltransferase family 2 protein [Vibrio campbellii]